MQRPLKRGRLLRAARDPWSHRLVLEVHLDVHVLAVAACRSAVACISALIFVPIPVMRVVNRCKWLWAYAVPLDYRGLLKPVSSFLGTYASITNTPFSFFILITFFVFLFMM